MNTPSAAGLLHILPRHTNNTENASFLFVSDDGVAAIDDDDDDVIMGFIIVFLFWVEWDDESWWINECFLGTKKLGFGAKNEGRE